MQHKKSDENIATDPDNVPPRSRLFMVVPKSADGGLIESEMATFPGIQYCKTDLIASKGIVFVKYSTSSAACSAMEAVQASGTVAGYRVKIMLAEPKTRRSDLIPVYPRQETRPEVFSNTNSLQSNPFLPHQVSFDTSVLPKESQGGGLLLNPISHGSSFSSGFASGLTTLAGDMAREKSFLGANLVDSAQGYGLVEDHINPMATSGLGFDLPSQNIPKQDNSLQQNNLFSGMRNNADLNSVPPGKRLFIVVHKGVNEETLASVFRCYPGMEYLDLKRDRTNGRSKGYAYVNYHSLESAKAAQAQLNGIEFPKGSGCQLKVLFAAPPGVTRNPKFDDIVGGTASSVSSEQPYQSPVKAFAATPSQDTAATTFRLPSPTSGDSVGHFNYVGQYVRQNSARTDPSSVSHDSLMSPLSSPLGNRQVQGTQDALDLHDVQGSLAGLKIDLGFFEGVDSHVGAACALDSLTNSADGALRDSVGSSLGSIENNNSAKVVYSVSENPLEAETAWNIFQTYGAVENIEFSEDKKVTRVIFVKEESVSSAINAFSAAGSHGAAGQMRITLSPP